MLVDIKAKNVKFPLSWKTKIANKVLFIFLVISQMINLPNMGTSNQWLNLIQFLKILNLWLDWLMFEIGNEMT